MTRRAASAGKTVRRVRRVLFALAVVGGLLWLAPMLVPDSVVRGMVRDRLAAGFAGEVSVEQAEVGWLGGLRLGGIEIDDWSARGVRISVDRLTVPLSPIRLAAGRVAYVQIEGLRVTFDATRPIELPAFPEGVAGAHVSEMTLTAVWPDGASTRLSVPRLDVVFDPATATVDWRGHGRLAHGDGGEAGDVTSVGTFQVAEQGGQRVYSGQIDVSWRDLALGALRLDAAPALRLERLTGRSTGTLTFRIFPDFHFDWRIDSDFSQVGILRRDAGEASRIDRLALALAGQYDPVTGKLNLRTFDVSSPVLAVQSALRGHFEPEGLFLNDVRVAGRLDSALLVQQVPALADVLSASGEMRGPCRFEAGWRNDHVLEQVTVKLDATETALVVPGLVCKPAGTALALDVALGGDPSNSPWMTVERMSIRLADMTLRGRGRLPRYRLGDELAWWLDKIRRLGELECDVAVKDMSGLATYVPAASGFLESVRAAGPVGLTVGYTGHDDQAEARLAVRLPSASTLAGGNWLSKGADREVDARVTGYWSWVDPVPQVWVRFAASDGTATIETGDGSARVMWSFHRGRKEGMGLDVVLDMPVRLREPQALVGYSPALAGRLETLYPDNRLTGRTDVRLQAAARFAFADERWRVALARVAATADAGSAGIDLPGRWVKGAGTALDTSADLYYSEGERTRVAWDVRWRDSHSRLAFSRTAGPEPTISGSYGFRIADVGQTLATLPAVARAWFSWGTLDGAVSGDFRWVTGSDGDELGWEVNASDLGVTVDGQELKRRGVRCRVSGRMGLSVPVAGVREYRFWPCQVRFGESVVDLVAGRVRLEEVTGGRWAKILGVGPLLAWRYAPVQAGELALAGRLSFDSELRALSNRFSQWCQHHGAAGYVDFSAKGEFRDGVLETQLRGDLGKLAFTYADVLAKRVDVAASARVKACLWADVERGRYTGQVESLAVDLGPVTLTGEGFVQADESGSVRDGRFDVRVRPVDLAGLRGFSDRLAAIEPAGLMAATVRGSWENGRFGLGPSSVTFSQVSATAGEYGLKLDGRVKFSDDYCQGRDVRLTVGESDVSADWRLVTGEGAVFGTGAVSSAVLDVDALRSAGATLQRRAGLGDVPTTREVGRGWRERWDPETFDPIRRFLSRSQFALTFDAEALHQTDATAGIRHDIDSLHTWVRMTADAEGRAMGTVRFKGRLNDGIIKGNMAVDLSKANPPVTLDSDLVNVQMTAGLQPMVEDFFPGMIVDGRMSNIDRVHYRLLNWPAGAKNYPVGQGEMVFTNGVLVGKAAPDWVTRVFPGLNFVRYKFTRMHTWYTKSPDGTMHNNMIFRGRPWNIYMEGDSYADGRIRYRVGVDMLARFESKYWSSVGQGRVPIFSVTGRIVNRKIEDHRVKYQPLSTVRGILIQNNPIRAAYYALKQRLINSRDNGK